MDDFSFDDFKKQLNKQLEEVDISLTDIRDAAYKNGELKFYDILIKHNGKVFSVPMQYFDIYNCNLDDMLEIITEGCMKYAGINAK